jgi:hypothetical protein
MSGAFERGAIALAAIFDEKESMEIGREHSMDRYR